jgi:hypothetical protein
MKKTNIRIKNIFMIEENNEYYSSSVTDLEKWKTIGNDKLEDYKEEKVTEQVISLMKKYDIYSNVNFFEQDDKKTINVSQKGGE